MSSIKVSIVVPIYNASLYLKECLDSLVNQTYKNIEIILVNDGSSDSSLTICEEFEKNDKRVIVINQENKGVSVARNSGIKKASGKYLIFIDSDDYCELNMVEKALEKNSKNRLIIWGYRKFYINKERIYLMNDAKLDTNNILYYVFCSSFVGGVICNKMYSLDIIKSNNIYFNEEIHLCEDLVFLIDYLKYVKDIHYISESLYNYRMRRSSASFDFFNKKSVSILNAYDYLVNKYSENYEISNYIKYNYLLNYYKLKKYIPKEYSVNYDIINNEKTIIKESKTNLNSKIMYFLIKKCTPIYKLLKKVKGIFFKLYD